MADLLSAWYLSYSSRNGPHSISRLLNVTCLSLQWPLIGLLTLLDVLTLFIMPSIVLINLIHYLWLMYVGVLHDYFHPWGTASLCPLMNVRSHKANNSSSKGESAILIGFVV